MGCLILLLLELLWVALGLVFGWICYASCWDIRWFSCAGLLFGGGVRLPFRVLRFCGEFGIDLRDFAG